MAVSGVEDTPAPPLDAHLHMATDPAIVSISNAPHIAAPSSANVHVATVSVADINPPPTNFQASTISGSIATPTAATISPSDAPGTPPTLPTNEPPTSTAIGGLAQSSSRWYVVTRGTRVGVIQGWYAPNPSQFTAELITH